jgi:hypothetical protein
MKIIRVQLGFAWPAPLLPVAAATRSWTSAARASSTVTATKVWCAPGVSATSPATHRRTASRAKVASWPAPNRRCVSRLGLASTTATAPQDSYAPWISNAASSARRMPIAPLGKPARLRKPAPSCARWIPTTTSSCPTAESMAPVALQALAAVVSRERVGSRQPAEPSELEGPLQPEAPWEQAALELVA